MDRKLNIKKKDQNYSKNYKEKIIKNNQSICNTDNYSKTS